MDNVRVGLILQFAIYRLFLVPSGKELSFLKMNSWDPGSYVACVCLSNLGVSVQHEDVGLWV